MKINSRCFWRKRRKRMLIRTRRRKIPAFFLSLILLGTAFFPSRSEAQTASRPERRLGLRPATPEMLRGIPLAFTPYSAAELPRAVDLSKDMPPVGNQGKQMSCTAWSVAYAVKSYQEKLEERRSFRHRDGSLDPNAVFSPSFIYNQINNGRDAGSFFADAFNLLHEQGAAPWADMPYREEDFTSQPGQTAMSRAKRFRIDYYRQVNVQDPKELKAHLNAGYPVLIGATVDKFFSDLPRNHIWKSIGQPLGAHAMVVVGYDDDKSAFKIMNSWGLEWGDDGFGWIDYAHFRRAVNEA
ncbi:MAG: C1 family peptidase, partial [Candidatus Aminicenantes bacterium]|nr:C1 family peptidase [Candidatus Aminicenantes bacterium]